MGKIRVTIWNEYWDELRFENVSALYPRGIHGAIAGFLGREADLLVRTVTPADDGFGLSDEILGQTDVLMWWGHVIHHMVPDEAARKVCRRVLEGMGLIALHSALYSKPFELLVGPVMNSAYREWGEKERLWVVNPAHEIARGLGPCLEIAHSEVYREPTGLPLPDELVFISWYAGGEAGISGGCYARGRGRVFSFTPGHEDYPIYHHPGVQRVLINAVRWAHNPCPMICSPGEVAPLEDLDPNQLLRVHKDRG